MLLSKGLQEFTSRKNGSPPKPLPVSWIPFRSFLRSTSMCKGNAWNMVGWLLRQDTFWIYRKDMCWVNSCILISLSRTRDLVSVVSKTIVMAASIRRSKPYQHLPQKMLATTSLIPSWLQLMWSEPRSKTKAETVTRLAIDF